MVCFAIVVGEAPLKIDLDRSLHHSRKTRRRRRSEYVTRLAHDGGAYVGGRASPAARVVGRNSERHRRIDVAEVGLVEYVIYFPPEADVPFFAPTNILEKRKVCIE